MTDTLWTLEHIAQYLVVSEDSARRYAMQVRFPLPCVLPSVGKGERNTKRWIAAEVKAWAESQKKAA